MPKIDLNSLNHSQIHDNFMNSTIAYEWGHYIIRCAMDCDGNNRIRQTWPFVYAMSEWQWVNAAMFDIADANAPKLVAVWVFSPSGDETNLILLSDFSKDVFEFHVMAKERHQFPMDKCCDPDDVFSCSSGDDFVKRFRCPALEDVTYLQNAAHLLEVSPYKEEALNLRRASHRKFYDEIEVEHNDDEEDEDEEEEEEEEEDEEGYDDSEHIREPPKCEEDDDVHVVKKPKFTDYPPGSF